MQVGLHTTTNVCRKHRQKRNVQLIVLEGVLQWLNLLFYILPNILMTVTTCYIFKNTWFWLGFARWTCWNSVSAPLELIMLNASITLPCVAALRCLQSQFSWDSTLIRVFFAVP